MMASPRVLVGSTPPDADVRVASPAHSLSGAWSLLLPVGLALFLVGAADLALAWYPTGFGRAEWEFGTITSTLNGLPVLVVGLGLLTMAAVASGRRWLGRVAAIVFALLAIAVVAMALVYATTVPLAMQAVRDPVVALGVKKAVAKSAVQSVVYPVAFLWIAFVAWRRAGRVD